MGNVRIKTITPHCSDKEISRFYEIMVHAYAVTEVEIWGDNYTRMFTDEFLEIIQRGELIGAWMDAIPVGSIHVSQKNAKNFSFGLFSVDFEYKGRNIGRKLIEAAEKRAIEKGGVFMELEVLRLKNKELEVKRNLHDWYLLLGYEWVMTADFVDRKPDKSEKTKHFIAPSVFDCYRKKLV